MDQVNWILYLVLSSHLHIVLASSSALSSTQPMRCADTKRLCTSFLAFKPRDNYDLRLLESMFDVLPEDITIEGNNHGYLFIKKNCSCLSSKFYATRTTYTIKSSSGYVYDMLINAYGGLALLPHTSREAKAGAVVSLKLFCGCSSGLWNYMVSYVMNDGDSLESLSSRFGVSMGSMETINEIYNPDNVSIGSLLYIPLNSVPGHPYPSEDSISPVPIPAPASAPGLMPEFTAKHETSLPAWWVVGGVCIGFLLIILCIGIGCYVRSKYLSFSPEAWGESSTAAGVKDSNSFFTSQKPCLCNGLGWDTCSRSKKGKQKKEDSGNEPIVVPRVLATNVLEVEKPLVFTYEEIVNATGRFSESNLLGNGTYGSVYRGYLQEQEVAVKRMTATKTKEFMSEMNILCKVHHSNLVELIGYAASNDELFLVYELAQNGSLSSHLHEPQNKGFASLSWIMRAQIALDTARGLEYIHEHTKTHYVHRDVKTSNILLDNSYRAKISDFGLAKLVARPGDGDASITKVVGTYGYVAPEYLRDGLATAKSDVYAFGVVLFEIISGKEAIVRMEGLLNKGQERRPLASTMRAALRNYADPLNMSSLKDYIDPNLVDLYPQDCLFEMVMLARQCVDEDPILRPDMKQNVITLSHILLSSIEWEASLGGNSQVFSGLVQGR